MARSSVRHACPTLLHSNKLNAPRSSRDLGVEELSAPRSAADMGFDKLHAACPGAGTPWICEGVPNPTPSYTPIRTTLHAMAGFSRSDTCPDMHRQPSSPPKRQRQTLSCVEALPGANPGPKHCLTVCKDRSRQWAMFVARHMPKYSQAAPQSPWR